MFGKYKYAAQTSVSESSLACASGLYSLGFQCEVALST